MPRKPKRPCTVPGCGKLVDGGRCDCGRKKDREPDFRVSAAKRGYDRQWRKVRRIVLEREPLCRFCYEKGEVVPATEVDHIKPISQGGARLDPDNLRSLCKSCHSSHTARQGGGFGNSRKPRGVEG